MIKPLLKFIPAKWKVREEVKAKGEGQLALGENSLLFWEERLGWSPEAARYLATAFAFGVRENIAAVLERAQQLSESPNFEERFVNRSYEDPSVSGAVLEASKFISSKELRDLLGRILASDVSKPGSVSRRAVSLAQDLTPNDLREFLKLRAVFWHDPTSAESPNFEVGNGFCEDSRAVRTRPAGQDPSVSGAVLEASKFISSKELRDLLGRILASDVSKPGSVSRRAVSLAQDLTPNDLREFLKLRAVFWHDPTSAARSLAGKPLAGFCATRCRRIQVLYGIVVYVIRCNIHYFIDNRR